MPSHGHLAEQINGVDRWGTEKRNTIANEAPENEGDNEALYEPASQKPLNGYATIHVTRTRLPPQVPPTYARLI